jgi:hypothetical protein
MASEAVVGSTCDVAGLVVIDGQVHETVIFALGDLESLASLLKYVLLVVFLSSFGGSLALFELFELFL